MWERVDVRLNQVTITDANTLYPYRGLLSELLNYNDDEATRRLRQLGWYKDTVG
jgi:hypothetical protein